MSSLIISSLSAIMLLSSVSNYAFLLPFPAEFFSGQHSYYEITDDFDLEGKTVALPKDAHIFFRGGRFYNGTLKCDGNAFSGRSGLSIDVSLIGSVRGPLNIEIFELQSNDRSFDIGPLINVSGEVCKSLIIPEGVYYLKTPVRIDNIRFYQQYADLIYNGNMNEGVVLQFYGGNASVIGVSGKLYYDTKTKIINYSKSKRTNIIGVEFVNINNSNINIGDVEYFNNNIRISAYGAGNSYNKYTINVSAFSNEHLRIFQKDSPKGKIGWCNENIFIGGRFCNWSNFDWDNCESVAIRIEGAETGDTYNGANSLLFIKPCMEGFKSYAVYAKNTTGCHWQDARTEGCKRFIKFVGVCRYNEVNSMYGPETIDFIECSTYPLKKADVFPVYSTDVSSSQLVLDIDTQNAKFFRVIFNSLNGSDAKARIGVQYLSESSGKAIVPIAQRTMSRPKSTNHPNSFYYNSNSARWMLASDSSSSEFFIPDEVSRVVLTLTGQYNGVTVYSDQPVRIIEK